MRFIATLLNIISRLLVLLYLGLFVGLGLAGFFHGNVMTVAFLGPVIGLPALQVFLWLFGASQFDIYSEQPEMDGGWEEWEAA